MHWRPPINYSIDTRTLEPGDIYIPVKGPHFDGHDFIPDAIRKGASKIIDEDLATYAGKYRKKLNCHVIGITGSYGKTTVKDMLYSVLSQRYQVVKTKDNQNNEIGVPLTLLQANATTDILLVEMGMRKKGDIDYLSKLVRPTHVIVTGVGLSHAEFFKHPRDIAKAKAEIFKAPLKWENPHRITFLCNHHPHYPKLFKKAENTGYKIFPYTGQTGHEQNLALAYLVGQHFGLIEPEIEEALSQFKRSEHRLQTEKVGPLTLIDDSYNANPDGMTFALSHLRQLDGRKICVFGDMLELGNHSKQAHQALESDCIDADVSLVFCIGNEMKHLQSETLPILHFDNKQSLHDTLIAELKPNDSVLVKGSRGLKMEETVAHIRQHFCH